MLFFHGGAVTSNAIYFADHDACIDAEQRIAHEFNELPLNPHPVFYPRCQPGGAAPPKLEQPSNPK
jgi:hypothetical protein